MSDTEGQTPDQTEQQPTQDEVQEQPKEPEQPQENQEVEEKQPEPEQPKEPENVPPENNNEEEQKVEIKEEPKEVEVKREEPKVEVKREEPKEAPKFDDSPVQERSAPVRKYDDDDDDFERSSSSYSRAPVSKFEYDVNLSGEGSYATAAQLATLEKRNKALIDQIEKLEDKFYDSEEKRVDIQRKLIMAVEEAADYRTLLDQREAHNAQLRAEVDELGINLQDENSHLKELDSEHRKLEHKAAVLQSEIERNERVKTKLDKAVDEIEGLRHKVALLLNEKEEVDKQVEKIQKEVSDLEKKLHSETLRSRELENRTLFTQENVVETERKRAQQAIDYVRQTLKAKIRVLEMQLEEEQESDSKYKKEKRRLARDVKLSNKKLEEMRSQAGLDERRIETLELQLSTLKDRRYRLQTNKTDLENKNHKLSKQVHSLETKLDAAILTNAKLNAILPNSLRIAVEEEAAAALAAKKESGQKEQPKQRDNNDKPKQIENKEEPRKEEKKEEIPAPVADNNEGGEQREAGEAPVENQEEVNA